MIAWQAMAMRCKLGARFNSLYTKSLREARSKYARLVTADARHEARLRQQQTKRYNTLVSSPNSMVLVNISCRMATILNNLTFVNPSRSQMSAIFSEETN
jgi:hypothetical protein